MIKCPSCGKWFQSLGYARHRQMHYEQKIAAQKAVEKRGTSANKPIAPAVKDDMQS